MTTSSVSDLHPGGGDGFAQGKKSHRRLPQDTITDQYACCQVVSQVMYLGADVHEIMKNPIIHCGFGGEC